MVCVLYVLCVYVSDASPSVHRLLWCQAERATGARVCVCVCVCVSVCPRVSFCSPVCGARLRELLLEGDAKKVAKELATCLRRSLGRIGNPDLYDEEHCAFGTKVRRSEGISGSSKWG